MLKHKNMIVKKSKHFLFHSLLKQFQFAGLQNKHLLVAVSGGVDSMTLLAVLWELKVVLNLKISVVHVHHGAKDKKQRQFQDISAKEVENFYISLPGAGSKRNTINKTTGVAGFIKRLAGEMNEGQTRNNEAEMRKCRYQVFADCMKQSKADYLTLAHTANDLLETRLIRLVRGTGEQGLEAMSFKSNKLLRPFIHIGRSQIMDYAKKQELKWCEDPSNQAVEYSFRNWIRHKWLPQLEKKRPGSINALSRSLQLMTNTARNKQKSIIKDYHNLVRNSSLRRDLIVCFSLTDKKRILAYYLKEQGFKDYRTSHILELLKQLDRSQKKFTFSLLGKTWAVSSQWLAPIKISRSSEK